MGERRCKIRRGIKWVALGIGAGILIKLFVLDLLVVSGTSMSPRIPDGASLLVAKCAYGIIRPFSGDLLLQISQPRRNDVVVYRHNGKIVVKRCVAVEGDALDFFSETSYTCRVNGLEISLTEGQYQRIKHSARVPEGMIFAVGDNYDESVDSRDYGFVSVRNMLGKGLWR
ncbi:MAG: signal peptidase I [Spirochaetaceae bacterium]|jgi:signal peptidase I|nr:signal peptidase I [Spirochaetaceae bacterium]